MDVKELRKKSDIDLIKLLKLNREHSRDLRFRISAKQHKDVRDLRQVKKVIARIRTVQKEKIIINKIKKTNVIK
ncbi:MAG: 50S ribosomal protein L29 [Candidatus Kerfeldbacteria bacterium]